MHRIDADGHVANAFTDGDSGLGILGTKVDADWLNAVQEEIANLLEGMGITLVKGTNDQLEHAPAFAVAWGWVQVDDGVITVSGHNVGAVTLVTANTIAKVELEIPLSSVNFAPVVSDDESISGTSNSAGVAPRVAAKSKDGGTAGVAYFGVKYPGTPDADLSTGHWAFHFVVFGAKA